jgi:hypothetical protein
MIEWQKFKPGTSFFVPCIDRTKAQRVILKEIERLKAGPVICKHVVERGIYGLRIWRDAPILPTHS